MSHATIAPKVAKVKPGKLFINNEWTEAQSGKRFDVVNPSTEEKLTDCGILIYREDQPVFAGGSGCACAATTTYGHLLNRMRKGELKRILVIATGALLSPMSYQQKETIPCVAHAISMEI